ncbi:MAG: carboxylating nicotinate-nucleotide diphosphorylase [Elusimicrobia bacterium]|nr:carboxylating nicotinate-nucleotide diphosphorylase [Elusimicrobiota bacterium]
MTPTRDERLRIPGAWKSLMLQAVREDRVREDVTTRLLIPARTMADGVILAKEEGILCGRAIVSAVFRTLDQHCVVHWRRRDGQRVRGDQVVAQLHGPAKTLLAGERTALNFLSRLSGIATLTHQFVQAVRGTGAKVYDTRKTTPGWRTLERYAVRCGGGWNHRDDLSAMVLVKDNHWALLGKQAADALQRLRRNLRPPRLIEVEAQTLAQVRVALEAGADIILLDNLSGKDLGKAVRWIQAHRRPRKVEWGQTSYGIEVCPRPMIEVSGGVTLSNVRAIARLGVERISVGQLTHSAAALDFSFRCQASKSTLRGIE